MKSVERMSPLSLSLGVHFFLIGLATVIVLTRWSQSPSPSILSFEVIDIPPIEKPQIQEIQTSQASQAKPQIVPKKINKVSGIRRDALTAKSSNVSQVKKGNTLTKKTDQNVLKDSDPTTLPVPEKEYLLTQMPSVLAEAKIRYPENAKQMGLEGVVTLSVLIDKNGKVRDAKVLEGLLTSMDNEALRAIFLYKFAPAFKDGQAVASQIRFAVRFVLEKN